MSRIILLVLILDTVSSSCFSHFSLYPRALVHQTNHEFVKRTDRFWEFSQETNSWVELKLPYHLISCVGTECTKVGSIEEETLEKETEELSSETVPPHRRRISLTKMSGRSIWITGQSGSIYERFWNGVQWVIAPHDLPEEAGPAVSVFIVNQTILALSEAGHLYQMQISENTQAVWAEFTPDLNESANKESGKGLITLIKSGFVSYDTRRACFCSKNGLLIELNEIDPLRWTNHGRPPGADVAVIADASNVKTTTIYTISSAGSLYEYEKNSKPPWKRHVWRDETDEQDKSLVPLTGCGLYGLTQDHSVSIFLLTKSGDLVERQLKRRKWKWIIHGRPRNYNLTSITPSSQEEDVEKFSLFLTTSTGYVFEYRAAENKGMAEKNGTSENWINHKHPLHAKAARGISGLQFQAGRTMFPLDDGRLAELHLSGQGGENYDGSNNIRRKAASKYIWSVLDAPESEGWNAEYCTGERGATNCMTGTKDEPNDLIPGATLRRRRNVQPTGNYFPVRMPDGKMMKTSEELGATDNNKMNLHYRMRVMQEGRSFFLVTEGGLILEYLHEENVWFWLKHEHSTRMKGVLGSYNGSVFMVDAFGTLLIRESSGNELTWINCSAMKKGRQVIGGPPWDLTLYQAARADDSLFFISENGRLLQFTVALRKFKWKDCKNPLHTKVATIVDQEIFRRNIVFVTGTNGRLYQYNRVTELWHEHDQSQHLILSKHPGTAARPSLESLAGSIFMVSEEGGLIEYNWNAWEGWNWVEHGTPSRSVTLAGATGPWFSSNELFLVGSDGNVYLRYVQDSAWRWKRCKFPEYREEACTDISFTESSQETGGDEIKDHHTSCNSKVASTRPIRLSEDTVIFELRDGRLAEMRRLEDAVWVWSRVIGTPTSSCEDHYWMAMAL